MRNNTIITHLFIGIITVATILLISCKSLAQEKKLPIPVLKAGLAKLLIQMEDDEFSSLKVAYLSLFSTIAQEREAMVDNSGFFSFEIPLETSIAWVWIPTLSGYAEEPSGFCLEAGKETKVKYFRDERDVMRIKIEQGLDLSSMLNDDPEVQDSIIGKMLSLWESSLTKDSLDRFLLNPHDYASYAIRLDLGARLRVIEDETRLSTQKKILLTNMMKLLFAESLFRYPKTMSKTYNMLKEREDTTTLNVSDPDRNYYTFLKEFDLNNPFYLCNPDLLNEFFQTLLRDRTLQIPRIEDRPVGEWLTEAKTILAELVGFDEGLFYDLLVINTYAWQLNDEMRPLSDQQIKNLASYYKGGEVEKIILMKNEEIKEASQEIEAPTVVPVPSVPNDALLDAIISKYKGKVVVVDFWATWCAPCLEAMNKIRTLKKKLENKEVVFVYFADTSSPKKLWNEKIQIIGGEHYYFSKEQSDFLMEHFNVKGIPAYVIFDRNGKVIETFTGYPGDIEFRVIIETH